MPADAEQVAVEPPGEGLLATWVLSAPPMEGGEYLSAERLQRLWEQLDEWVRAAAADAGGPAALLGDRAPRWRQVGQVCFHLAENKNDQERPFAFLTTYASGFGAGGRLKHLPLRNALQQYAGARNRAALINLLSSVEEAARACDWVRALADSGDLYRPLAWPPAHAYRFLQSVPELERSGLSVRVPNWWRKRPRPRVSVTIGSQTPARVGADAVLDFKVEMALGDSPLSAEEIEALRTGGDNLCCFATSGWRWTASGSTRPSSTGKPCSAKRTAIGSRSSRACACWQGRRRIFAGRTWRRPTARGCR